MEEDRDSQGRFTQRHADEDVLEAVREHEPAATSEVADELGVVRQSADYRLRRLEDAGQVASKKIAASLVWFTVEDPPTTEDIAVSGSSSMPDPPAEPDDRRPNPGGEVHEETTSTPGEHAPGDAVPAFLDAPQHVDRRDALDAVDAVREYLEEHGPASMREIVTEVMPDHPLGYDVPELEPGDRYRGAWWRKIVRPAIAALDDVEYRESHSDYQFVDDRAGEGER